MVIPALAVLSSCNQELIQRNDRGYLSIGLDQDLTEDMVTRADGEDGLVFAIDVFDQSGEKVAGCDDHRTTTENPIELKVGKYNVVARSGEKLNAAFDAPYYEGRTETPVSIKPETTAKAELTCSIANTAFSVEFSDELKSFTECRVTVTNGVGDVLVLTKNPDAGDRLEAGFDSKAYFDVTGTLTWELYLKNSDGGEYIAGDTISDVKGKQHYHLKFYLGEDASNDGALILKVALQNTWADTNHDMNLEFNKADAPQIKVNDEFGAVSGQVQSVNAGDNSPKILMFSAKEGIKDIAISHNSDKLVSAGLPMNVNLAGASSALISSLSDAGVVVEDGLGSIDVTGLFAKLGSGTYTIEFVLTDNKDKSEIFVLCIKILSAEDLIEAEATAARTGWAAFAQFEGKFFDAAKANSVGFQYRKASDSDWKDVDASKIDVDAAAKTFKAVVYGLAPSTDYVFRAVTDTQQDTKTVSFRTSEAGTLHNLSFDEWYKDGKAWMPNASGNAVWDTANPGTSGMGYVPTTPEETTVVKGKAARLETQLVNAVVVKKLAAGNIYTGKFGKVAGVGAELTWGVPFTSRPLALRGYWKYAPKTIDKAESPYTDKKGQMDACQVQIFLTDWSAPFLISTSSKQFVDFSSSAIIARGEITTSETHQDYVQFTLPLVYRNNNIPTHIVISGAASMYGDYFTGGVGSVLLLDEFELIYDPAELTETEYNTVFGQVKPF